jgi:hypothetical protein
MSCKKLIVFAYEYDEDQEQKAGREAEQAVSQQEKGT